jgi:hypothetical protein
LSDFETPALATPLVPGRAATIHHDTSLLDSHRSTVSVVTLTLDDIRRAGDRIASVFPAKELEIVQFMGEPFLMAYRPPATQKDIEWANPDLPAFVAPQTPEA